MATLNEELKELGIPKELFEEWKRCMNSIYQQLVFRYGWRARQEGNEITLHDWVVRADMTNDEYVEITCTKSGIERICVRHDENILAITKIILIIIESYNKSANEKD